MPHTCSVAATEFSANVSEAVKVAPIGGGLRFGGASGKRHGKRDRVTGGSESH
jgi:hypothetical protein